MQKRKMGKVSYSPYSSKKKLPVLKTSKKQKRINKKVN